MRIFEVNDFLNRFNAFLLESFKQDMYHQYPEAKDNEKFNNAIKLFNDNQKIKEAVKKKINVNNIAKGIKNAYPTADKFVEFINTVISELTTKEREREEYKQLKQGTASAGETDYWMIPCHTFKEVHDAAFKYVGNLPRLTKEEITNKYGIVTPKPATFYKTNKTPAEFLEYMKNEDNFFMAPSWCIAANKEFFEGYELETSENEKPLCYVFISKKYPNVRFCVVLIKEDKPLKEILQGEKIKITNNPYILDEVRDPWQIGGEDIIKVGSEMMKLAFGPKVDETIKDICSSPESEITTLSFSELEDGERFFFNDKKNPFINGSFNNLTNGHEMFSDSDVEQVNCKFPLLENAHDMFLNCKKLYEFTGDLPKLINGEGMFSECVSLKNFECKNLSELVNGERMFDNCEVLKKFECDLPKLKHSKEMFYYCESLERFDCDLSSLIETYDMFSYSGIKTFKSNLSELTQGVNMFYHCENLERFDTPLHNLENATSMFGQCQKLKSFNSELPNLKRGDEMFFNCDLMEFTIDMPKLIGGTDMFSVNEKLKRFNCKMPILQNANGMFANCKNLTSFESDLSKLYNGSDMFNGCKKLRRFKSNLSLLKQGYDMFKGCKLDTESVKNIAETISTFSSYILDPTLTIGVDKMDEEKEKYIKMIEEKGWKVKIE